MAKRLVNEPKFRMGKVVERTTSDGIWLKRDAETGRFLEVHSERGTFHSRPKSEEAAAAASEKRSAALKRLADR